MPIQTGSITLTLTLTESYTKESSRGQGSYGRATRAGQGRQDRAGHGMQGRAGYDREWWSRAGQPEELAQN